MPNVFHLILNPAALEYYKDIKEYVTGLKYFQYLRVVEHIGQEQKHYHMFLQLSRSMPKLSVKKVHGAHIVPKDDKKYPHGSTKAMLAYINCEDDSPQHKGVIAVLIDEEGEYKPQGGYSVQALLDCENVEDLPDYRMVNTWYKLKNLKPMKVRERRKSVKVYYIQGPSGIGKTNKAMDIAEEFELQWNTFTDWIKYENSFYSGVTGGAKIAIYDDFRPGDMKAKEFVNLIDYNKHNLNVKGGGFINNYNLIIITSVVKLSTIYKNIEADEPRKQWERRVELIDMYPPEPVHIGGFPVGYRTEFNQLEEYEVTDDWDGTRTVIN